MYQYLWASLYFSLDMAIISLFHHCFSTPCYYGTNVLYDYVKNDIHFSYYFRGHQRKNIYF